MLEYKIDSSLYSGLKELGMNFSSSKVLHSQVVEVNSGVYIEKRDFKIATHLFTRSKKASIPLSLDSICLPCSIARFCEDGVEHTFDIKEFAGDEEDCIHSRNASCYALYSNFSAESEEVFKKNIQSHSKFINLVFSRIYEGETPRVLLEFSPVAMHDFGIFGDIIREHSQPKTPRLAEKQSQVMTGPEPDYSTFMRTKWEDVGGLFKQKKFMRAFLDRFHEPETLIKVGLKPSERGGIFCFGPEGSGKDLIAEAVATELSETYKERFAPFFVSYAGITSIYRGGEAMAVTSLFKQIRKELAKGKRAMLFLREVQSVGQRRQQGSVEGSDSNEGLNQLLVETSRFDYSNCIVMAASAQEPYTFDSQLLRKGRFGTQIFFSNPTPEEVKDILETQIRLRAVASSYEKLAEPEINYATLSKEGQDFSLADWYYLLIEVLEKKADDLRAGKAFRPLRTKDFFEPIQKRKIEKARTRSRESII